MNYIQYPTSQNELSLLGGKAGALAKLHHAKLPIPAWFVLSPPALKACLTQAQQTAWENATSSAQFHAIMDTLTVNGKVSSELQTAIAQLCPAGQPVAVRSSAVDEDSVQHSFAGQLESFLFVEPTDIAKRIVDVWRSGFSERVLVYRQEAGLPITPQAPAVLIQQMIGADISGVAFAADPVSGQRSVSVVGAVYGLGTALVSGDADADTFHIDKHNAIIKRDIVEKTTMHRFDNNQSEGVSAQPVAANKVKLAALNDIQIRKIAALVRATSQVFGRPQDIEWAYHNRQLYLLQSRPITSLRDIADPDAELNIWDNSNIAESYGGVTTPLTFTFASKAYQEVYRQFCRILKVPSKTINANNNTYRRMLGLIRGRVYYNMIAWYRVLAMLPGFTFNRRFMEQMMGVKQGLPEDIAQQLSNAGSGAKLLDAFNLLRMLMGLISNHWTLPKKIDHFYQRLNNALDTRNKALSDMRPDELCQHYHALENQLLTRWDAPLINDFFAMIFHGVLRKLSTHWCKDSNDTLHNDLLCGEGGMISAEPAKRVCEMAQTIATESALIQILTEGTLEAIQQAIESHAALYDQYQAYLEKFGDRCLDELKLESITLHDDPMLLLRSVGQLAQRIHQGQTNPAKNIEVDIRHRAESQVSEALQTQRIKYRLFQWILKNARHRVRDRENLRFERTRLFGHIRRLFVELGKHFTALDMIQTPKDIFYLEVDEIMGIVEGTTSTTNLKALIAIRREEFQTYESLPAPADRFETYGMVHQGNAFQDDAVTTDTHHEAFSGIACCPGVVRGPVRVITDPRQATLKAGEILVAERTDPGWIMLFPAASALLVERGSLLSHSAIVAREMGIPAIVSISGITRHLKDGDWVEMDGSRGSIKRIEPAQGEAHAQ